MTLDPKFVLDNFGTDPSRVKREPTATNVPGRIVEIYDTYRNLGGQKTDGIDFDVNYLMDNTGFGDFQLGLVLTWVNTFEEIEADGTKRDLAGEWQHPEYRWTASTDWTMDDFAASARVNYIGEFADDKDAGATGMMDSMTTVDVNVSYLGFANTRLTLGANNLFDEEPPFTTTTFMGYDQKTHSAQGQFIYLKASYAF